MSQASLLPQQYENNNLHMVSTTSRTASSSTRTTKVIEELQDTLDCIQNEVEITKQQLQTAKDTKDQFEKEIEDYVESNKQLRININDILRTLEAKQELLDSTKKASQSIENKVKELKDEALAARKESDDLKRKENTLEKELNNIKTLRGTHLEQQKDLEASINKSQEEFDEELDLLQELLNTVKETTENVKAKDVQKETETIFATALSKRKEIFNSVKHGQEGLAEVDQQFLDDFKKTLEGIINDNDIERDKTLLNEVTDCKEEVKAFLDRIKKDASSLLIKDED